MAEKEQSKLRHKVALAMQRLRRSHPIRMEFEQPKTTGIFYRLWHHPATAALLLLLHSGLCVWFWFRIPVPGIAIAVLGSAAAVMTLRSEMSPREKLAWTVVVFALLFVEIRDTNSYSKQQLLDAAAAKRKEDDRFATILSDQQEKFLATQERFTETMKGISGLMGQGANTSTLARRSLAKLTERSGTLQPSTLPSPSSNCPIPPGAFAIYIGSWAAWVTTDAPWKQTVFGNEDYDLLSVSRGKDGKVSVGMRVFDERQNLIAKLDDNNLVATFNATDVKKPDESTLILYDHADREVLNVIFLNSHAVLIKTAILYSPDGKTAIAFSDGAFKGSLSHRGTVCGANNRFLLHLPR
jgi:hypothetical protein